MIEVTKVLVIEDSEDDRILYRRALRATKATTYDIAEADDGEVAMQKIAEWTPDCVLLDYSLPGRNGVEVLKRIRQEHSHLPVVMLTGQGNEAVAVAAMQAGAQDYITKSNVTPDGMHRAISMAIAHCDLNKRLHEQRLSLEIFTRALAHDLKEPVRTIKSFMALLGEREQLTPDGKRYFGYVHDAAERMGSLIDAVYYYTRLDGSAQQAERDSCDLNEVFEGIRVDLSQLISEREAQVTSGPLPVVDANAQQMHQVLQNLIANAIRHCETDPAVRVEAREIDKGWEVSVSDNGPGVEESAREKIFDPFTRFAHHKVHGLGMGLAICRRIMESHGGAIRCEAGENGGAVFVLTLPKAVAEPAPARRAGDAAPTPAPSAAPAAEQPLARVLVVDDNEAAIELTRIVLLERSKVRCVLVGANGAREALGLLRKATEQNTAIDLVLLDINMPEIDGFQFLERLRADQTLPQVPVVMCTTSSHDKDMERARALGAAGYITKPAELNKLRSLLDNVPTLQLSEQANGRMLLRVA